jgi:hypothetical protein
MQKYRKQMQPSAESGANATEAKTVQKNAASPKSPTGGGKFVFEMKRLILILILSIAAVCGATESFGQFPDNASLEMWLEMQNAQIQQMCNQMMTDCLNSVNKIMDDNRKQQEERKRKEEERMRSLKENRDKTYVFKNTRSGKYGAVIYFNGDAGFGVGGRNFVNYNEGNPIKVGCVKVKNGNVLSAVELTGKCTYFHNRIIVPDMIDIDMNDRLKNDYDIVVTVVSMVAGEPVHHADVFVTVRLNEKEAISNYHAYANELIAFNESCRTLMAMQTGGSIGGSTSSYGGDAVTGGVKTKGTCSMCGGKGWIAGNKAPTYGITGTHWCSECGRDVTGSHSHDQCPSCGGTGIR